jgi:hypothetical protein
VEEESENNEEMEEAKEE